MTSWDSISAGSNSSLFPSSSAALSDHAGLGLGAQATVLPASRLGASQHHVLSNRSASDSLGMHAQAENPPTTTAVMHSLAKQINGLESELQQLSGQAAAVQDLQQGMAKVTTDLDLRVEQAVQTAVRNTLLSLQAGPGGNPSAAAAQSQLNAAQLAGVQQLAAGILQQPVAMQSIAAGQQNSPDSGLAWMPHLQQASAAGLSPAAVLGQQLPHTYMGVGPPSGTVGGEIQGSVPLSPRTGAGLGVDPRAHIPRGAKPSQPSGVSPDSPRVEVSLPPACMPTWAVQYSNMY